jgi:hypothetical protein
MVNLRTINLREVTRGILFMKAMRRVIEMVKYSWMREGRRG